MYIHRVFIEKFRHLENVELGPFEEPRAFSDLVVLAGPNGGGKSTVLALLANVWSARIIGGLSTPPLPLDIGAYSFKAEFGLSTNERDMILTQLKQYLPHDMDAQFVYNYLSSQNTFQLQIRGSKSNEQHFVMESPHTTVSHIVFMILEQQLSRPLGFMVRSERYYASGEFQRDKLFESTQSGNVSRLKQVAFQQPALQYQDMFDFLIQERYHYIHRLGAFQEQQEQAGGSGIERPMNPFIPYNHLLGELFPGYEFTDTNEDVPRNLYVQIPSGEVIPFSELSSGEKEVFFILASFIRHNVNNSIVLIDEPELHLHPELARRLIQTMQKVSSGNQIWLATHNSEIIDEAGRDKVIYLARDPNTRKGIVQRASDEPQAMEYLRELFGYSGYIGVAKSIVFLEGGDFSPDRKMFSTLFSQYASKIKFVAGKSSDNLYRINLAALSILESNLGWMQFYLIRDRDYLTLEAVQKHINHTSGRMYVLARHEIENYLLIDEVMAKVQEEIYGKRTTATDVQDQLRVIAYKIAGEVLRDMVAFQLNLRFRPEDFSLGNFMKDQKVVSDRGSWDEQKMEYLRNHIHKHAAKVNEQMSTSVEPHALDTLIASCQKEIDQALKGGENGWRSLFPGKRLLEKYAKDVLGTSELVPFQNMLIKELAASPEKLDQELHNVMRIIAEGGQFGQ